MMTVEEWENWHYSNLPIHKQPIDRIRIFGHVSLRKDTYAFGINVLDKDLVFYLSMTNPEILVKYGNDSIDKRDIEDVMRAIDHYNLWYALILSIIYCIKSDGLTKEDASIDIFKIPVVPPDYNILV